MSENPPDDVSPPATPRTSVTLLDTPFVGNESLPPDLLAAFNLAAHAVTHARQILLTTQMFGSSGGNEDDATGYARLIADSAQEIWAEYPNHDIMVRVIKELADAAEPGSHFGSASAHESALAFADLILDRVWWVADPMHYSQFRKSKVVPIDVTKIRDRLWSIAGQLAKRKWPDSDEIIQACAREAKKAATRRPADSVLRSPRGEPTIWYHGNRNYSPDGINMRTLSVEEDDILQAFLAKQTLDRKELELACGPRDFARIVGAMRTRYAGVFAAAIQKPPGQASGNYSIRVRKAQRSKNQ
jgi:hypothetical protein